MNIRVENNKILHGDFTNPVEIATFSEKGLTEKAKELFVLEHNTSREIFEIFRRFGEDCSLLDYSLMISQMTQCYKEYLSQEFLIKRNYNGVECYLNKD